MGGGGALLVQLFFSALDYVASKNGDTDLMLIKNSQCKNIYCNRYPRVVGTCTWV